MGWMQAHICLKFKTSPEVDQNDNDFYTIGIGNCKGQLLKITLPELRSYTQTVISQKVGT